MALRNLSRLAIAALVVSAAVVNAAVPAYASASILGGGSGFAALEMDQWRADSARSPFNLTVNYVAQGSSFGRSQFAAGTFDFGTSDIQYTPDELPNLQNTRCHGKTFNACFVYVPVSAGGVSFMYNLVDASGNRVTNLRLTQREACKIFTGQITSWNDPELVATNPFLSSFNRGIIPVIRSDGAGESYVFSQFCIADAPDIWNAFIAKLKKGPNADNLGGDFLSGQPISNWPQLDWGAPVAVAYADGTANFVADPGGGANSITYVAAGYAKVRQFPVASVQNAAGVFNQPGALNVTVALGYASPVGNGTFNLAYKGPDPRAYFPSTYSYVLAQTTGFDPSRGATLAQFLCYAVSEGQVDAVPLDYAALSSVLVNIAINAIVRIPGAPSKANCPVQGAPPPPPPPKVLGGGMGFTVGGSGGGGSGGGTTNTGGNGSAGATGTGGAANTNPAAGKTAVKTTAKGATKGQTVVTTAGGANSPAATAVNSRDALDTELANDALASPPGKSGSTPTVWLLLAGLGGAWGASALLNRRKKVTP